MRMRFERLLKVRDGESGLIFTKSEDFHFQISRSSLWHDLLCECTLFENEPEMKNAYNSQSASFSATFLGYKSRGKMRNFPSWITQNISSLTRASSSFIVLISERHWGPTSLPERSPRDRHRRFSKPGFLSPEILSPGLARRIRARVFRARRFLARSYLGSCETQKVDILKEVDADFAEDLLQNYHKKIPRKEH